MTQPRPKLLLRFFPSLTDFVFLTPLLIIYGIGKGAHSLLADSDAGWHIRAGEWILENGRVPHVDVFSYTRPGEAWFAWEWLWDVIIAWLHRRWGMEAVILASTLLICLTCALLFRLVRRRCGNCLIAFAVALLAVAGLSVHWLARPLLVTPLFLIVFLFILEQAREGRTRWLLLLPLLTVVWTNVHGGFIAGLTLIGAYAGAELISCMIAAGSEERGAAFARSKPYIIAGLACLLASLVNPYGYRLHLHIHQYLLDPFFREFILEFSSVNFQDRYAMFFELMLLAGAVAAFRNVARKDFTYPVLFLGWFHPALTSARHIPVFMIVSAPFVAAAAAELLLSLKGASVALWIRKTAAGFDDQATDFDKTDRVGRFHIVSAVAFLLIAAVLYVPAPPSGFQAEFDPEEYPARALQAIQEQRLPGNIFTTDRWGGYLIYRLHPAAKVFIDGRSDFYGEKFCKEYLDVINAGRDWEKRLNQYGVNTVLVPVNTSLARVLALSAGWRIAHEDGLAIVFRRS